MIGVFSSGMIALKLSWKIVRTNFMIDMYIFVTQISYPTRHMTCAQDSLQYYTRQISYWPTRYFFGRDSYFDYNRISSDYYYYRFWYARLFLLQKHKNQS